MLMTKNKNRSNLQYFAQAWSAWAFLHFKVIRAILGSIEFRYAFRIFKKGECNYDIH